MPHGELPYAAFLAAFLVLITLPWHWRARNIATLAMVAWLFVVDVIYGVDAIIWHQSVRVTAVVWCDITSRIIIGASMALPAACMCISIHLAQVASASHVRNTTAEKRRRQIIEMGLCFGVPLLWMGLHYTVQGHRFDVLEDYGCRPNTYISIPSIFLIWVPPLIFSTVTVVYSAIALMHFLRHRITFARLLEHSNSGLTTSRYLRLMAMAFAEIVITVISTSITLWFTTLSLRPWTNWADVHWNFSRIDAYPTALMPSIVTSYYYATWYIVPFSSLVFFVFFAFGQDAIKDYAACLCWLRTHVFRCSARRDVAKAGKGYAGGSFVALHSASLISGDSAMPSLPSYQTALDEGAGAPAAAVGKDKYDFKERYVAEPIDLQPDALFRSRYINTQTDSDRVSCYTISAPPSPSHTGSVASVTYPPSALPIDIMPPAPAHPHDLV